jgi:NitT/TauT family transport system ATP-binding protein
MGRAVTGPNPLVGAVFQQPALFPWLTVEENVLFGPRAQKLHSEDLGRQCAALLEVVGLGGFAKAFPSELSGGMSQRASLARVLILKPRLLLLDEPFGALDAQTRLKMQGLLVDVIGRFNVATLMVTHDIDESLFIGDRVLVLSERPATVRTETRVSTPRPRPRMWLTSREFAERKREALAALNLEEGGEGHETAAWLGS